MLRTAPGRRRRRRRLARARGTRRRGAAHAARPARGVPRGGRRVRRRPGLRPGAPRRADPPAPRRRGRPTTRPGAASRGSRAREPLQPGETVSLRWRHPSARAVLSVTAMAPAASAPRRSSTCARGPTQRRRDRAGRRQPGGHHARRQRDGARRPRRSTCPGSRARRTPRPRSCWARSIAWSARSRRAGDAVRRARPRGLRATTSCSSAIRSAIRARAAWASSCSATRTSRGRRRPSIAARRSPCTAAGRVLSTTLTHRYHPVLGLAIRRA